MRQVILIHPEAPPKPAFGAACNGCGVCCLAEPCPLGMLLSRRRSGACRALRWSKPQGRYACGMAEAPLEILGWHGRFAQVLAPWLARWALRWISAGRGCDAAIEIETRASH